MKLKIASNTSYKREHLKVLVPYEGKDVTLEKLTELAKRVPIAIVASESDANTLAIDHPHSW